MKSGSRVLTFKTKPPAYTQRAHYTPRAGDGGASIRRTSAAKAGADKVKCQDTNVLGVRIRDPKTKKLQWIVILGHYARPYQNG